MPCMHAHNHAVCCTQKLARHCALQPCITLLVMHTQPLNIRAQLNITTNMHALRSINTIMQCTHDAMHSNGCRQLLTTTLTPASCAAALACLPAACTVLMRPTMLLHMRHVQSLPLP